MKTLRLFFLGILATLAVSRAQAILVTNTGWYGIESLALLGTTNDPPGDGSDWPQGDTNTTEIAEALTSPIQALARGLESDPVRIFNYVHDHIRYVLYFGAKKGAQLTLLERSGNDFDQCALLVALLRAAGYTNAGYQFGWMVVPYDNPDGSHRDLRHWLGLNLPTNNTWAATSYYLRDLFIQGKRSYPIVPSGYGYDVGNNAWAFQRVWVTLPIGGTTYYLDPAFKVSEPIAGISLTNAMQFSSNGLMSAAGGTSTADYVTNLNEAALRGTLAGYTTNLLNYLQSNLPNASVEEVLSGRYIVPATNTALSQTLPFPTTNFNGLMAVTNWVNLPTNLMARLSVSFRNTNHVWYMPDLQGQRLSLTVSANGLAQLWQEDKVVAQTNTLGGSGTFDVNLTAFHPRGGWDISNNVFKGEMFVYSAHMPYQNANASYALLYAFEPDWGWLRERHKKLDAYRQRGLSDTSRELVTETLNVMGLNWQMQLEAVSRMLAAQIGVLAQFYHRIGRMSQEAGLGYYVDIYSTHVGTISSSSSYDDHFDKWLAHLGYFGSAMEHGLIEQLQSSNLAGASTVKILQLANTNGQAVYMANSNNWATVKTNLVHYDLAGLTTNFIDWGDTLLLPQDGSVQIAGSGSWSGTGLLARDTNSGVKMLIGDAQHPIHGGYVSDFNATVNPFYVGQSGYAQPLYFNAAPPFVPRITGADPVSMVDATFQVDATDCSLGQAEPRGLSFSRHYSSSRRHSNLAGLSPGWLHNYYLNATALSAPEAGLGGTTPAQMAAMLVATRAAIEIYSANGGPKNWLVTALIAKWGVDQLTGKAVSIMFGKDTVQFVKQPDDRYTPPAHCTMALLQTNSVYWLQERHGNTFKFNGSGFLTNLVDQYGQSLNLTYGTGAASNWVSQVKDWEDRALTFNYTGTPLRLTSVSNSTGVVVAYGYTTNAGQLDLTSVTDPESKTGRFLYDTNHQIIAVSNAVSQLVVSNRYDDFGRVATQYTQGDTNKLWQIFWSEWETVEQDPAGGKRRFFYDDKTRLVAAQDALGNVRRTVYDGQDHAVLHVSPLNETNRFEFDGRQNLLRAIDPLGFTNQFFYDAQDHLVRTVDARGNNSYFGYNTQHSLAGTTNGAGDWVAFSYNADGTLASRGDAGGTTSFGYDNFGQLSSVTHPGSLGSETFQNNARGDVTNHINARGFATAFQYNQRRELTNTMAPANVTAKVAYDAVGNVASATDPRGFTTSNTWSATRKLLRTTLPATPQGTPTVTNVYDARDWLLRTTNNPTTTVAATTSFANDAAQRLLSVTDPLNRTARFGYDADGRQIAATNAASEVVRQFWNARGELARTLTPTLTTIGHSNDAAGNQIALTNRNTKRWRFEYDGANRLTNTISPRTNETRVTYDARGLVSTVREPSAQTASNFYDAKGRLTNITDAVGTRLFTYDANDNLITLSSQLSTLNYTYDGNDRMTNHTTADGYVIQYRYDANGNLTNLIYPGNRTVTYAYDSLNRLTNVTDWANGKTTYVYDLASRVTSITRPNGTIRTNAYDAAGQLTNAWDRMAGGVPVSIFTLRWDGAGRITNEFAVPVPHAYTPPGRTNTFDDDNRLWTFNGNSVSQDADGNLTYGPLTNNTFVTYGYDARNRLTNVSGVSYSYDPAGNRITLTNGASVTRYVVNPNAALSQVLMRVRGSVTNYYTYGLGLLYEIRETASSTNTLTYHYDYRGSTIALTDGNGIPRDRIEYSPYGTTTYRAGTNDTPFLYNGRYGVMTDANGLLYMRARYYNPYLCRFINADPAGFLGGLNFYAYADGNPVSLIDPFGLGAMESGGRSWISQALSGTALGDWAAGFERGLQSWAAGEDLNRYTWSGSDAYLEGIGSGYKAVPNLMEVASIVATVGLGGNATRSAVGIASRAEASVAAGSGPTRLLPSYAGYQPWAGEIRSVTVASETTMYRVWGGGSRQAGPWLSPIRPTSAATATESLALPSANTAQFYSEVLVPAGTRYQIGTAAGANGLSGGGVQVQLLEQIPNANFGPGIPLPRH